MKHPVCLGYQVATPDVKVFPKLTCLCGDPLENIRFLREIGYDAVEFMTTDPTKLDPAFYRELLAENQMRAAMVCTGEVFGTLGLSFTDPDPERYRMAVNRIKELIDFAAVLGTNINIGRARGHLREENGLDNSQALDAFHEICAYAKPLNVEILIEPVEKPHTNWIHTAEDGAALKKALGEENFNLMLDYSAMCYSESSVKEAARLFAGTIVGDIHLTEQDRHYPGYHDANPFRDFIAQCAAAGYVGPYVIEVYPIPDQQQAAIRSFETIAPILKDIYGWKQKE